MRKSDCQAQSAGKVKKHDPLRKYFGADRHRMKMGAVRGAAQVVCVRARQRLASCMRVIARLAADRVSADAPNSVDAMR